MIEVTREADIVSAVHAARTRALRIKAIGSGHSYNDIADINGAIGVSLSSYAGIEHIDSNTHYVTVRAGTQLGAFCTALAAEGLALPVLGAITEQTVAGLISTATHGTGRSVRSISDYVVGLRFVDAGANVVELSLARDADLLHAARVGLGCLGMISAVTFACIPGFNLVLETQPADLHDVIANLDAYHQADYFGFWWFPQTRWTTLRIARRKPLDPAASERSPARRRAASRDVLHEAALWVLGHDPRGTSFVNAAQHALRFRCAQTVEGRWDDIFPCPGSMRQVAIEYALPIDATAPALAALNELFVRHAVHAPVDVRFGAADQAWLSPSFGRDTCYIGVAIGQPFGRYIPYEALFGALEAVFSRFGGRPHWGKMHTLEAAQLSALYPQWNRFAELRNRFDRERIFANAHLNTVLGK